MTTTPIIEDPFTGITGAIDPLTIKTGEQLKIAVIGPPKSGKSWFSATAPGPVLHYDFDNRKESLELMVRTRNLTAIRVKTLIDLNQMAPTAIATLESDLANLKYRKKNGKPIPVTFILDSMTFLKKWMENELMSQMGKDFYRTVKTSPVTNIRIPKGWDVINGVRGYMEYMIAEFAALGNIICVFHVRDQKDKGESTKEETKYTGQLTVDPQYLESLLTMFNEVYYIAFKSGKYEVQCKPNYECIASTTLELDQIEPPDISLLLKKHRERLTKKA